MKKFYLMLLCMAFGYGLQAQTTVFSDGFENGTTAWTLTNYWGLSTAHSHSTSHALTESPVGNYTDNQTSYATMTNGVNLSTALSATLSFWAIYNIEGGFDYMYLQVSANGGTTWNTIDSFDDTSSVWTQYSYSLGGYVGNSNVKVRFKFVSDGAVNFDGMYIDDFLITSSNVDNAPPLILHSPRPYHEGRLYNDSIIASIIDISGVATAEVIYTVDGGSPDTISASSVSNNIYYFLIPTQQAGASVNYYIYAKDSTSSGNAISTATYNYIAGSHIFYDNGVVDFVDSIGVGSGAAMKMTLAGPTTIAAVLLRNYTDPNRPNDSILVHIWSNNMGLPGTDLMTPVKVFPAATLQNTSAMTIVDLRAYSSSLSNLSGDVFIGYTVPSGGAWATITQPSSVMRSFKLSTTGWALASGTSGNSDFHFRVITSGAPPPPLAGFNYDASTDPLVQFVNTSSNATQYRWNFNDGSAFDTAFSPSHTFPNNGLFLTCLRVQKNALVDSICHLITISSYQAPVSNFSFDTLGDPSVQFTDLSTNNPSDWYWDFDDNASNSTSQNPTHTFPAVGGTYNVCLTASSINGNGNTFCQDVILTVGTGLDENGQAQNIKIFPNPVRNEALIQIFEKNTGGLRLELFDMTGKKLDINYSVQAQGVVLKRGSLSTGQYIVRLLNEKEIIYTGSLIIR